jgi:hypothetical protein
MQENPIVKKTADIKQYHKDYRKARLNKIKISERFKYQKSNIDNNLIELYGMNSVCVASIIKELNIIKSTTPEILENLKNTLFDI